MIAKTHSTVNTSGVGQNYHLSDSINRSHDLSASGQRMSLHS